MSDRAYLNGKGVIMSVPSATQPPAMGGAHHGLAPHEVVLLLETDQHLGLRGPEAAERLARFGPNVLPAAGGAGFPLRAARQFHHPLIYILITASVITAVLGEYVGPW